MIFEELQVLDAIRSIRDQIDQPGSDRFLHDRDEGIKLTRMICAQMINEPDNYLVRKFINYRKSQKADLLVELYRRQGATCFYAGRVPGDCCDEVEIDRIVPGGDYSLSNCVLACRTHNNERRDQTFTSYLGIE